MKKKTAALVFAVIAAVFLSSCSLTGTDIGKLLTAPKPSGGYYEIQRALDAAVDDEYTLRYPTQGDYRSAFVLFDLNGDENDEAIVFYSTASDNGPDVMHINLIAEDKGVWASVCDINVQSTGIESVSFADFDGNGKSNIIVGWEGLGSLGKTLTVYSLDNGKLTQRMQENYTTYVVCDLRESKNDELLIINLNTTEKTSEAKLFGSDGNGFVEAGRCALDGGVTSYLNPKVSKLGNGKPGVFIDAKKGASSMLTELIIWENDNIKDPFYDKEALENYITIRPSTTECKDFDDDGVMDIPRLSALPAVNTSSAAELVYLTIWQYYDGKVFTDVANTLINFTDGYCIKIPREWGDEFTVQRRTDSNLRILYRWDYENSKPLEEILRVQKISLDDWEQDTGRTGWFEIIKDSDSVYAASIGDCREMTMTEEELKQAFSLIN